MKISILHLSSSSSSPSRIIQKSRGVYKYNAYQTTACANGNHSYLCELCVSYFLRATASKLSPKRFTFLLLVSRLDTHLASHALFVIGVERILRPHPEYSKRVLQAGTSLLGTKGRSQVQTVLLVLDTCTHRMIMQKNTQQQLKNNICVLRILILIYSEWR